MTDIDRLRDEMVAMITGYGHAETTAVRQALHTVPRHEFVPAVPADEAYANRAITIKAGPDRPASCASVPSVVAAMLDQLDVRPGHRVLEIGAGTGYNAALLAELTGPDGTVTTVDIDPEITAHAHAALARTGYQRVDVVIADGALGHAASAPYDRIIVTVGPWDLPPAWFDQLRPGGRLVVPLHWRGQARSVAFVAKDGHLRSDRSALCGFIPMVGITPSGELTASIAPDVLLHFDPDQTIDPDRLHGVLDQPATTVWSDATVVPEEPFDGIWVTLTGLEPGTCRLSATDDAIASGTCDPAFAARAAAIAEDDSLAYMTRPRQVENTPERRFQLGATGHGPRGTDLAERLVRGIDTWSRNRTADITVRAYHGSAPDDLTGLRIVKHHTTLVIDGSRPG